MQMTLNQCFDVQSADMRPRTECQNKFNLDSSDHPVRSRLNTCLTSCDGWHRTLKILPSSPNPVTGTLFPALELRMYAFVRGNKTKVGHQQPEKLGVFGGIEATGNGTLKRHDCLGLLLSCLCERHTSDQALLLAESREVLPYSVPIRF